MNEKWITGTYLTHRLPVLVASEPSGILRSSLINTNILAAF